MRNECYDCGGAVLAESIGGFGKGSACVWWIESAWGKDFRCGRCVPAISSTRMAHLSLTLPTRVICGVAMLASSFQGDIWLWACL